MQKTTTIMILPLALLLLAAPGYQASASASGKQDQMKEQEKEYEAHRQYVRLHFKDNEMDFALQWVLGSTSAGGCEIGEAYYTASQIKDGDPVSWQKNWAGMAQKTEKLGRDSLQAGHKVSAREALLRASNYFRTAIVSMLPEDPRFKQWAEKSRECLKTAAKLFDPPVEYLEIPFEGTVLPGYFWKADNSGKKQKTLIMIGGGETHIEDTFLYIALATHRRGYNYLTVDIPGQGMLPLYKKFYRPDVEVPLKLVVDYALNRPEVDPKHLAMYGISGGGYFVPRAAGVDKRIKAIAVNSAVIDQGKVFGNMPVAQATPEVLKTWTPFKRQTVKVIAWRWGLGTNNIIGLVDVNKKFIQDPKKVDCPTLIMIGEGEYANEEIKRQQHQFYDSVNTKKKKMIVTKAANGASSHCMGENRSLMSQVLFDWLDEVFK
jgi:alpha-beta hydrolase superfamily lysophospholipase